MRRYSPVWLMGLASAGFLLGGCTVKVQSFVMPDFETVRYEALDVPPYPEPVYVEAQYKSNGIPDAPSARRLRQNVVEVLSRSGIMQPTENSDSKNRLIVIAENFYDADEARSAGVKAGLSMGLSGRQVIDRYKFTVTYRAEAGGERLGRYDHAYHTALGRVQPPKRAALVKPGEAFHKVVEDVMLKFLFDLEAVGSIEVPIMFVPDSDREL